MYFKRLEMHGFKSFAEPVVIDFHEGVTCVVGPNGSGKSNISDAIRWVLGEQSPKTLRGGKMEDVIFSGTESRKARGMAQVTLVIDNSTKILPIDYNEVAITRRMYRSGEGEYLINNNQCRLRDIKELIMDTGIGVDGYSVIGQGKIADIVSNKPESRREIFEEAAGVVMYKNRKAETTRKLAASQANLDRTNDIIGELEGRMGSLETESKKAQEYIEISNRYKELEINITLRNVERLEISNGAIQETIKALAEEMDKLKENKAEIDEDVKAARKKNDNLDFLGNQKRDSLIEKNKELSELTSKSRLDSERLSNINKDAERLSREIDEINVKLEAELLSAGEIEENQAKLAKRKEDMGRTLAEKIHAYDEIQKEFSDTETELSGAKNELFRLHGEIAEKNAEIKNLDSFRETFETRKNQLAEEEGQDEALEKQQREQYESAKALKEDVRSRLDRVSADMKDFLEKSAELGRQIEKIELETDSLRINSSKLSARKRTIEEMESNYDGYNGAVRFIMKSGAKGLEGIVADIMKVPAGYEIAVETALGAALQNVVCKGDDDAKAAVNLLKRENAGRLTFLPLESIKGGNTANVSGISEKSGFIGVASEVIGYDKKYENIFRYLLGRVAIVEDMDCAVALSKQAGAGLRLVTLDGEVINSSGAITGGRYKNSTANLLSRKSEVNKLTAEIDSAEKKIRSLKEEAEGLRKELENAKTAAEVGAQEAKKLEMEDYQLDTKIEALEGLFDEAQRARDKRNRELETIACEMKNNEVLTEKLRGEVEKGEEEVLRLNALIDEKNVGNDEIKERINDASDEITSARVNMAGAESALDGSKDLLKRVLAQVADYQEQISSRRKQLQDNEAEKERIMFGGGDDEELHRALVREIEDLEAYIEEVTKEKAAVSEELQRLETAQGGFGDRLNSLQDQKHQNEIKSARNDTQLDSMKSRLWEEFEVTYAQAKAQRRDDFTMQAAVKESREIRDRIRELGDVNVGSIKEFEQVSSRYGFLTEQRSDMLKAREELLQIIDDMDKKIKTRFKENFDKVVVNFETVFKELFGGGHAELSMDNEDNPLEAGIEIVAQPPGKKLQNINLMSGGEKTMTAIALMFAVLKTKPTPFCILDEVEAALDDSNIDRFSKYLRRFSNIQFTIVTHQKATMEHADVLYGVTMPERGVSKVLSLRMGDDFEV